jgi:hypothetical protein
MSDIPQWVNLKRKTQFVEDDITTEDRLSPEVKFEAKFKMAKLANFKVRVQPLGNPAQYTAAELGRNANFKLRRTAAFPKPDGSETLLTKVYALPCAGGNRFQIEAKYKGKVVTSQHVLIAQRKLFYQILSMKGISPHNVSGMEQDYWNPGKNYYIKLQEKAPRNTIDFIKTIHQDNYIDFIRAAKAGYSLEPRRPYAFTLVFSNLIADYDTYNHAEDINLELPSRVFTWKPDAPAKALVPYHIWYEMDPAHDARRYWLAANRSKFVAADGTVVPIDDSDLEVVGPPAYALGGYKKIEIQTAKLRNYLSSRKGVLKLDLDLRIVAGWTLGFSFNEINLITVANYVEWQPTDAAGRAQTLNHEMGHKVGMTASGMGFLPDAPGTYYKDGPINYGGHRGPHCSQGTTYSASTDSWSGAPGCVMFGANGAWSGGTLHLTPKEYCPNCEKIVRKVDVDPNRLHGFQNSVMDY